MNIRERRDVSQFKEAAEKFCTLLETVPDDADSWVEKIVAALAHLYAYGHDLPDLGLPDDAPDVPDSFDVSDEEWKEVESLVSEMLGEQVKYWSYFDPSEPPDSTDEPVFGILSDDLADIYRDVKPGLRAWATGDDIYLQSIIFDWKFPLFGSHWGVHAVSALRALHPIAYLRGIQPEHNKSLKRDAAKSRRAP